MAKRLTDTEKWKDDWYLSLSNDDRIVWQWLVDNCSHAGVCKKSIGLLNMMCRVNYTEEILLQKMEGRIIVFERGWFIPKFIKFQYTTLLSKKPVIVSVVKELFSLNIIELVPQSLGNDYQIVEKSFDNHYLMIKDKDKDKDKSKDNNYNNGNFKNFSKNEKPPSIWIDGVEHSASKNKDGWVYPTIIGVEVNRNDFTITLTDGSTQPLGRMQKMQFEANALDLQFVKKGMIQ